MARLAGHTTYRRKIMLDNAKKAIANLTEIGVALLALAIVASLLVGASNTSIQRPDISDFDAFEIVSNS